MQQQELLFGFSSGISLSVLGGYLAIGGIADWSLFAVGLGVAGIALVYFVKDSGRSEQEQPALVPIDATHSR